jgi:glycosyltransferase involved in cell wall biosynthesis
MHCATPYCISDLHVSASQFETLGNTVLEAFACGLPVVVPRCQGFQDTVGKKQRCGDIMYTHLLYYCITVRTFYVVIITIDNLK